MAATEWNVPDLYARLSDLMRQVPPGRVTTYGDLADALGSSRAARWIGGYLQDHPHNEQCPCHRIVRATGELGQYIDGLPEQERRLKRESVDVHSGRIELDRYRFCDFNTDRPLVRLTELQKALPQRVQLTPFPETPELVAGVDVSYPEPRTAVGAYVLVETETGRLVWSTTIRMEISFPYISGFLAFREIPVLLKLLTEAEARGRSAPVVFVDGNGILHPRGSGIATHLGVLAERRTVGISKKLLCGQVDLEGMATEDDRPVIHKGRTVGMAIKAKRRCRPVFVSPGQFIEVTDAVRLARRLFHGNRLPEPIYRADALSRQSGRELSASQLSGDRET